MFSRAVNCGHDLPVISAALPERYPYLLDTAAPGPSGELSLLLSTSDERLCLDASGEISGPGAGADFLSRLDSWYQREKRPAGSVTEWPFAGGWFLYLGYELAREIEPVVSYPAAGDGFPVAFADRCPGAICSRPSQPGVLYLLAETRELLEEMQQHLQELPPVPERGKSRLCRLRPEPPEVFKKAIGRIHDYIVAGDVFQVNVSRGWQGEYDGAIDIDALYASLRRCNPAPFAGMVRWKDQVLMSSSPERLVQLNRSAIQARPIAGTRPRGGDHITDRELSRELLAHPKERAEHIMLIDLERNDLGRVCRTGSVEVNELMVVETYKHVHHIVSNVRGQIRRDVTPADVIRAVFPGGTITGCPKVRCMQIIAELEQRGRSFYTGSIGYLGLNGNMDLNILIRSMLVEGNRISFRTGAGIVADSDPDKEVAETEDKARGLLSALGADTLE